MDLSLTAVGFVNIVVVIVFVDKAKQLTAEGKGKHFIGDFLPPDELEKFLEKVQALKEGRDPDFSDYAKYKLGEDNIGYQLLQKAGWSDGLGLGAKEDGRTVPVNKLVLLTDTLFTIVGSRVGAGNLCSCSTSDGGLPKVKLWYNEPLC